METTIGTYCTQTLERGLELVRTMVTLMSITFSFPILKLQFENIKYFNIRHYTSKIMYLCLYFAVLEDPSRRVNGAEKKMCF